MKRGLSFMLMVVASLSHMGSDFFGMGAASGGGGSPHIGHSSRHPRSRMKPCANGKWSMRHHRGRC